jgi:NTP pyrophosphatase (non-canonical NTP hydrolase)
MTIEERIIQEIVCERGRQDALWGVQNHHPEKWLAILVEEVGEAAKDINDHEYRAYRAEMVQVAAVALAAIDSLDRNKWPIRR